MLSTIRTILAFNKNLTLGLPSALTWVFLYNHEGPCGVILFSLEMMIIKKHLLSDFSSIWLSLPLWSLLPSGCATGFSVFFFCVLLVNSSVLLVNHSTQQSSFYLLLDLASWGLFMAEGSSTAHCTACYSVDVLASSGQVYGCLSPQFAHAGKFEHQYLSGNHWLRFKLGDFSCNYNEGGVKSRKKLRIRSRVFSLLAMCYWKEELHICLVLISGHFCG